MGTLLYLPIDVILAWHAYKLAKDINKEPGLQQTIIPSSIVEYAGFWRRLAATIIDIIIISIAGLFIGFILGLIVYRLSTGTIEILGRIVQVLVGWLYYAVMESFPLRRLLVKRQLGLLLLTLMEIGSLLVKRQ